MVTLLGSIDYNADRLSQPATALRIDTEGSECESPVHQHRKGQLVVALHGGVTCEVPGGLWMVPPQCGVWIPGGMPHSNRTTANARLCFLFVEPGAAQLPTECATLALTPLIREMILHLADASQEYPEDSHTARLVEVLLSELTLMPTEKLHLPVSDHARLRQIASALTQQPDDRSTVAEWGERFAMSERTLARLVLNETGMTFGRWRRQLHLIIALQRLASGATVQRVSEDLGYDSVSAFITMFKKALGKSPARYFSDK